MNRILLAMFLALTPLPRVSAALKETRARIEARYGEPVRIAGYPDLRRYTYRFTSYEIEVTYNRKNLSIHESYWPLERNDKMTVEDIERYLQLNAAGLRWRLIEKDRWVLSDSRGEQEPRAKAFFFSSDYSGGSLVVEDPEYRADDSPVRTLLREILRSCAALGIPGLDPSGRIKMKRTFTGVGSLKSWAREQVFVVQGENEVLEIPWSVYGASRGQVRWGQTYTVKIVTIAPPGLDEPIAFLSDREHESRGAAVIDSIFCQLLQVQTGDSVVFDHSVCELHHEKMRESPAEIAYGLLGPESEADAECDRRFPHHRNFAAGGCVETNDSPKTTQIYICPKCVAEYNECVTAFRRDANIPVIGR